MENQKETWLTKNIVEDENAPAFYAQGAILGFSILFSPIFGAVLLCLNLQNNRIAQWRVLSIGVAYSALLFFLNPVISIIPGPGILLLLNTLGGFAIVQLFWNKYIGKDTKYRARSIFKPLIISLIITVPLIIFYTMR